MAEPTSYDDMLSRLEYLTDTAETPKEKAEAAAYRKKVEAKFPKGQPGDQRMAAKRIAAQRAAIAKRRVK